MQKLFPTIFVSCWALMAAPGSGRAAETVATEVVPLIHAHAHNDYQHPRPLLDALDHGFCSIEADVWLVKGKLLVAHDLDRTVPERTLETLYLNPLKQRVADHGGRVFPGGPTLTLLIDFKSDGETTYRALCETLSHYRDMLTRFESGETITNAVTVIISGNRPRETMEKESVRLAGYDGRIDDMRQPVSPHFMPLVSDDWNRWFRWRGEGPLGDEDKQRLDQLVQVAGHHGVRLRLWGTPDSKPSWIAQYKAKVDLINSDDLAGLGEFLQMGLRREANLEKIRQMKFPQLPSGK